MCTSSTNTTGDYGDLPSSYGVAWHTGTGALKLGATWTADTTFAAGSDLSDDGVSFVGNFTPGLNATMRVNVQGTPLNGRWLHVWFDWNRNGVFDTEELVHDGTAVNGNNDYTVAVPADATGAVKYRVRLYDTSAAPDGISYNGAAGGEVEDGEAPLADFTMSATPASQDVCRPSNAAYTVNVGQVSTFSGSVSLAASVSPTGPTTSFSANPSPRPAPAR